MRFTYDYDRAEFIRAYRETTRHADAPIIKRGPAVLAALAVFAAVAVAVLPHGGWRELMVRAIPWLAILALWLLFFARMLGPLAARQYEKQLQDSRHPQALALDEDGYVATSFSGTARRHWTAIPRAVETKEFLLFYVAKQYAIFLPKRAIPAAELPAVRRLLREKLGDRAKLMDAA
jgi:hypothetical protein